LLKIFIKNDKYANCLVTLKTCGCWSSPASRVTPRRFYRSHPARGLAQNALGRGARARPQAHEDIVYAEFHKKQQHHSRIIFGVGIFVR